jgi:NAD(P)-dependent dehydrogenase (short-subunit alcohol dehydrogenase family)
MLAMGRSEVVVITGASAGVGRAAAVAFGRRGARVALLARDEEGLEGAKREVERAGGRAMIVPTDVADYDQVAAAAVATEQTFGEIDVWVSNAMTTILAEFVEVEPEEFRRATEVTYLGAVWSTRVALERMLDRDRGSIVLVGSALSHRGIPLQAPYCGAKFAIRGMFESVRCELRHRKSGVSLTMVQLPALNTPQFEHCRVKAPVVDHPMPVPPIYQPEVAAEAIYWAAHNRRREVYVGGSTVLTILGNKLAPWLAEWYLGRTGYESQQLQGVALDSNRADNLFAAIVGDAGAHGRFDAQSHSRSYQTWLSKHRSALAAGTVIASVAALARRAR